MTKKTRDTLASVMVAFVREHTWTQAEIGRHCGVTSRTVRAALRKLQSAGMPLEREEEHPHVYWSVPKGWFPGAVSLEQREAAAAARLLARLPKTDLQAALVGLLTSQSRANGASLRAMANDDLVRLEDAAKARLPLFMHYYSASRGIVTSRVLSVQRLTYGKHPRLVAFDHANDELRWFRVDRIQRIRAESEQSFQHVDDREVSAFVAESADGFHGGHVELHVFRVRAEEWRWVVGCLPCPFTVEHLDSGVRISAATAGLPVLARFVAGLGDAAVSESAALRKAVLALAVGALAANKGTRGIRSVRAIESTHSGKRAR